MTVTKVCPVVLRRIDGNIDVLAFKHPLAGLQLVKGTIEMGEPVVAAALRELAEESGIVAAAAVRSLGIWSAGYQGQVWEFIECQTAVPLAESWVHEALDDGGHAFEFFWHPLYEAASPEHWHAVFLGALAFIQNAAQPIIPMTGFASR